MKVYTVHLYSSHDYKPLGIFSTVELANKFKELYSKSKDIDICDIDVDAEEVLTELPEAI